MDGFTKEPDSLGPQETLRALVKELQLFLRSELSAIIGSELSRALAKELPHALEESRASFSLQHGNGFDHQVHQKAQVGRLLLKSSPVPSPRERLRSSVRSVQSVRSRQSAVLEKVLSMDEDDDDDLDDDMPVLHRKPQAAKELYEEFTKTQGHQHKVIALQSRSWKPHYRDHVQGLREVEFSDNLSLRDTATDCSMSRDGSCATAPRLTLDHEYVDAEPPTGAPTELMLGQHSSIHEGESEKSLSAKDDPSRITTRIDIPGAVMIQNDNDNVHTSNGEKDLFEENALAIDATRSRPRPAARFSEGETNEGFRDLRAMYLSQRRNKLSSGGLDTMTTKGFRTTSVGGQWRRSIIVSFSRRLQVADFFERVVESATFAAVTTLLLIVNAISIGVQTHWMARNRFKKLPLAFELVEISFCVAFTIELALRIGVYRQSFFVGKEFIWNWMDLGLVTVHIIEVTLMMTIGANESEDDDVDTNVSFLRVLRVLRLIRVARVVRVIRLISELRTIIASVANSMKSLLSTVVLIGALVYMTGVFLTQLVTDKLRSDPEDLDALAELELYYTSLPSACMVLFQSFTSGVDWAQACDPLMEHISPLMGVLFVLFIAFVVFAMLNVITGVFVDSAVQSTAEEKDAHMVTRLHAFLCRDDETGEAQGVLTWERFEARLDDPEIQLYFKTVDLDISEARGLFQLLDADQSGAVEAEEFVMGCLRLRGQAKAIDLATLMYESRRWHKRISKRIHRLETHQHIILDALDVVPSRPPTPKQRPPLSVTTGAPGLKKLRTFIVEDET